MWCLMMFKRILAVGDIHGMYDKLIKLMELVEFNPVEDLLIFLGDYIDRGRQSLECLDYVMELHKKYPEQVIPLLGNHEVMCLNYYEYEGKSFGSRIDDLDRNMISIWLDNGGVDTFRQFKILKKSELQKRLRWMKALPTYYAIENYYFCHAGIQPFIPLKKQREKDLLWIREAFFELYDGCYGTVIAGHTPVQILSKKHWINGNPPTEPVFLDDRIILCDTGSFLDGGKLSCVDVLTGKYWQA